MVLRSGSVKSNSIGPPRYGSAPFTAAQSVVPGQLQLDASESCGPSVPAEHCVAAQAISVSVLATHLTSGLPQSCAFRSQFGTFDGECTPCPFNGGKPAVGGVR